jgi:hypothetical protein
LEPSIEMQILQRLTAVETKLDLQLNAKDIATDALNRVKSLQHRVDKIDKIFFWFFTTFFGSLLVIVVAYLAKGGFIK